MEHLESLKTSRDALDAEIAELESGLKEAYTLSGSNGWINADSHRFRMMQQAGRRTLDRAKLRQELLEFCDSEDEADRVLARCEQEGRPFSRFDITKLN